MNHNMRMQYQCTPGHKPGLAGGAQASMKRVRIGFTQISRLKAFKLNRVTDVGVPLFVGMALCCHTSIPVAL
eukprot:6076990-Amphidinium_carterae.1